VNRPPAAIYIQADSATRPGGVIRLQALAIDPEDDCLTYSWSASGGTFVSDEGSLVDWQAPTQPGQYRIRARATDPRGRVVQGQVVVTVTAAGQINHAPTLEEITASNITPEPGQVVQLTARASDPDRDPLTNWFHFYGTTGARVGSFDVLWRAPSQPGIYRTYGIVYDRRGGYGFNIRELSVNSAQALNRSHPSYGQAGQLLIESFGRLMWVGINNAQVAQEAAALAAGGAQRFVVGRVVPDTAQRHCFYLDPSTVGIAEITAEGMQTTIDQISRRPAFYAPGGGGGFDAWAISARLIQFVPKQ
jgi:chitodextrinase